MSSPTPLKFLMPGWFATVMGLCGLSLAWASARPAMGDMATGLALVLGALALLVALVLGFASGVRVARHPMALAEDLRHPVRHAFVAAVPVSLLLLATVGVGFTGPEGWPGLLARALWWLGSLTQGWATLWVLGRWLAPATPGAGAGSLWPSVTPVLLIAVVGNVLAPLAGLPLGHAAWAWAQFGVGALLWPVVLALLLARRLAHSPLPERLQASWFITLAPPSVIGLVLLQAGAPSPVVLACWGVALFTALWLLPLVRRLAAQAFGLPFWSLSFPLAAFTSLTLRLGDPSSGGAWGLAGTLLLAISSITVVWLGFATVRGLRDGSLLAPEPVATIQPA